MNNVYSIKSQKYCEIDDIRTRHYFIVSVYIHYTRKKNIFQCFLCELNRSNYVHELW